MHDEPVSRTPGLCRNQHQAIAELSSGLAITWSHLWRSCCHLAAIRSDFASILLTGRRSVCDILVSTASKVCISSIYRSSAFWIRGLRSLGLNFHAFHCIVLLVVAPILEEVLPCQRYRFSRATRLASSFFCPSVAAHSSKKKQETP